MPRSEFDLIADLFAPLATSKAALGLKDDVAILGEIVLTTDTIIAGVDFFPNDPPDTIARKALRVNLSDLAAKGARPFGYLLTLTLPRNTREAWLRGFAKGLRDDQKVFGLTLLGGDISSTPGPLGITVAMFGRAPRGKAILRNRARVGDLVFVSGTLGDSGAGLSALKAKKKQPKLIARYRVPEPRVALGAKLRGIASAALDVSDGLVADLGHIADTSGVHIVLNARALPLSKAYRAFIGDDPVRAATSGDDYEIAFTAPRGRRAKVIAAAKAARVPVTEIGWVMKGQGVALLDADGRPIVLRKKGWQHF